MSLAYFDYIVVGSGCAGAMAAQTLVEAGKRVAMLDVGETNPEYKSLVPNQDFLHLRRNDPDQYKYFIGEDAEAVTADDIGKGAQITPSREHISRNIERYIPMESNTFSPIESLAYGGLGVGWGLQCWQFSRKELVQSGLDPARMVPAYELVAKRIGISGTRDAAGPYTLGELQTFQPSPDMDRNMQKIHANYLKRKKSFDKDGIYLGRTPLALLTKKATDGRQVYPYRDMDFYDDNTESGWRPWITINRLRRADNFSYHPNFLATHCSETKDQTVIHGIDTTSGKPVAYRAGKLIIACGALGSARLALRSQPSVKRVPFLCNPYTYVPCVQPSMFGQAAEPRKIGFGQLSAFSAAEATKVDTSILTLYSYQSLMLFRVIKQAPLDFADARRIMQYVSSGLVVTGIQHSDRPTAQKYLSLKTDKNQLTGDVLQAAYGLQADELAGQKQRENSYIKAMRRTGIYPIRRMNPGHGSSVHYAGTMPFSDQSRPLGLDYNGKVHGYRNIYVADSSGFNFLPARGLTFTLLANAHLTAENLLHDN